MSEYVPTGKILTARQVIAESKIMQAESKSLLDFMTPDNISMDCNLFEYITFLPYALKHDCFRDFLLAGGYIEKVDTWKPVKIGDRFRRKNGDEYLLANVNNYEGVLIVTSERNRGMQRMFPEKIGNIYNITKEEFQKMCGSIPVDELERI